MKAWAQHTSTVRISGMLVLRKREFSQRDDNQWFVRVTDTGFKTEGWRKVSIDFLQETKPRFWLVTVDGVKLEAPICILPLEIAPKFRLPKD